MPFDPQVYRLASIARDKLCREAERASHDLRLLVAHANILDELLIELNAPKYEAKEHYTLDQLPQRTTTPTAHREVVVSVKDSIEDSLDDNGAFETPRHLTFDTSPPSLPLLSHDSSESESDASDSSDSESDSDDEEFETVITPTSPASPTDGSDSPISSADEEDVEPDEGDLALHRTKSGWRVFGSKTTTSENRQKRKDVSPIGAVTHEI